MGQRISYYKNNFKKDFKTIIFENFSTFKNWYLEMNRDAMEEFGELFGSEELRAYFRENSDVMTDFQGLDKILVDELTSEFIGSYLDSTDREGYLMEFFGPTVGKRRYEASTEMVLDTNDEEFVRLWNYLIKGRSLWDGKSDFMSYTNEDKIGFLTFSEQELLRQKIESYFGNIETLRLKYWTAKDRRALEEFLANPTTHSYAIFDHDPICSGLEYVLVALMELDHSNVEIITVIDNS